MDRQKSMENVFNTNCYIAQLLDANMIMYLFGCFCVFVCFCLFCLRVFFVVVCVLFGFGCSCLFGFCYSCVVVLCCFACCSVCLRLCLLNHIRVLCMSLWWVAEFAAALCVCLFLFVRLFVCLFLTFVSHVWRAWCAARARLTCKKAERSSDRQLVGFLFLLSLFVLSCFCLVV